MLQSYQSTYDSTCSSCRDDGNVLIGSAFEGQKLQHVAPMEKARPPHGCVCLFQTRREFATSKKALSVPGYHLARCTPPRDLARTLFSKAPSIALHPRETSTYLSQRTVRDPLPNSSSTYTVYRPCLQCRKTQDLATPRISGNPQQR